MPVFFRKRALADGILLLLLAVCGTGLLFCSEAVSAAVAQTVDLCVGILLPSLFPFFVLSSFLTSTGILQRTAPHLDRLTHRLFGLPGSCSAAILLGAIGGYPVGARTVSELYSKGVCTKKDALQTLRFCNNAGPAFLVGSLGAGILGNKQLGILLYALHLICALLIGLLFRDSKGCVKSYSITDNFCKKNVFAGMFSASGDRFFYIFSECLRICFAFFCHYLFTGETGHRSTTLSCLQRFAVWYAGADFRYTNPGFRGFAKAYFAACAFFSLRLGWFFCSASGHQFFAGSQSALS